MAGMLHIGGIKVSLAYLRKIVIGSFKFREYTISENITEIICIKYFLSSEIRY